MTTSTACYPWFHNILEPYGSAAATKIASGCFVDASGNVPCDPSKMAQDASAKMAALGWTNGVDVPTYTLARYMQSEIGGGVSGTVEEAVAVGEAAKNRGDSLPQGVLSLLLYRQSPGHPNYGFYGPIHGTSGVSTAPYGRWASTSQDPTFAAIVLADLIMSGDSGNFANDADDQAGPEYWISQGQGALNGYVQQLAKNNKYWVGPLPGVDHWRTFLTTTPGPLVLPSTKQAMLVAGLQALSLPAQHPDWPADLPVCSKPIGGFGMFVLGALAFLGGAWAFQRGYLRRYTERFLPR